VAWLRKAIEAGGLELAACSADAGTADSMASAGVAETFNASSSSPAAPAGPGQGTATSLSQLLAHRAHKTSLALAIYELGQCSMNGWGMDTDKVAGLRAFEIAGAMGDADAVAEAAFSYAKGVGCKRDMKKAAELYRRAEAMGVKLTGVSWIWKEKYLEGEEKEGERKGWAGGGKGLFGKKKGVEAGAA